MKISPHYDTSPIVLLDGDPIAVREPFLRQRRRFARELRALTPGQWAAESRCEGWRVQDVVAHLVGTDRFWSASIGSGLAGDPTRFLDGFDPKATPAAMVAAVKDESPTTTLSSYIDASDAFSATVEALDDVSWTLTAESPVGHVSISAVVHHALWDSWVHERDVLTPLGVAQDEVADEVLASLRYAAALGPALTVRGSSGKTGSLAFDVRDPVDRFLVTVAGDVRVATRDVPDAHVVLRGGAVELLEAFSVRGPWPQPIPEESAWLLSGLTEVFEAAPPA